MIALRTFRMAAAALAAIFISGSASAQAIQQLGPGAAGQTPMYLDSGHVMAVGGALLGQPPAPSANPATLPTGYDVVNNLLGFCQFTGYANAPYSSLCTGFDGSGNGEISLNSVNSSPTFTLILNGVPYPLPGTPVSVVGLASVPTNAALKLISPPAAGTEMYRAGFYAESDGGEGIYTFSTTDCTLNAGAGDNGIEVDPAANAGCWNRNGQGQPVDARVWGAPDDGATDAGAIINTACKDYNAVLIPVSASGFYINTPVVCPAGHLQGVLANAINPYPATGFPGQSWFLCSATVNPCVTIGDISDSNITNPIQASNLMIAGVTTPPSSGIVGLKIIDSYRTSLSNVHVYNFDQCIYLKGNSMSGADITLYNVSADRCQTKWWVFDEVTTVSIIGGNDGTNAFNGAGDQEYTGSADVYEFTATAGGSSYQEPNTIIISHHTYVNSSGGAACLFNWTNFTAGGQANIAGSGVVIANDHFEQHGFSGSARGTFCSDNTIPTIGTMYIHDNTFDMGTTSFGFFALNSATALFEWRIHDNKMGGCGSVTLAPAPVAGAAFTDDSFVHNEGCISASFTSNGVGSNQLYMSGNEWNMLTVAGSWSRLSSIGDIYSGLTDTATGGVTWSNYILQAWTPVLECGGTPCTTLGSPWAYTVNVANAHRVAGGFEATFSITVTSKGTASGAAMSITGLPYVCSNSNGKANSPSVMSNMTTMDVTSPEITIGAPSGGISPIFLYNFNTTAGGYAQMTDAFFTSSTIIAATVSCGQTM